MRDQDRRVQHTWSIGWSSLIILPFLVYGMLLGCDQGIESPSNKHSATDVLIEKKDPLTTSFNRNQAHSSSTVMTKIVAYGDSLTAGLGVPTQDTYPAQLQRRLDKAGYRVQVVNAGVSGETSAGGLRRVGWVLKSRPQFVILELGGNDGLRGLDPNETKANLKYIIEQLKEANVTVLLTGIKMPPNLGEDYTKKFANIYPTLAKELNIPLMPFFLEGVATHRTLMQADGIHPTTEGYQIIVEHVFQELVPLLHAKGTHPQEP